MSHASASGRSSVTWSRVTGVGPESRPEPGRVTERRHGRPRGSSRHVTAGTAPMTSRDGPRSESDTFKFSVRPPPSSLHSLPSVHCLRRREPCCTGVDGCSRLFVVAGGDCPQAKLNAIIPKALKLSVRTQTTSAAAPDLLHPVYLCEPRLGCCCTINHFMSSCTVRPRSLEPADRSAYQRHLLQTKPSPIGVIC